MKIDCNKEKIKINFRHSVVRNPHDLLGGYSMSNKARRHYRAAQKEVLCKPTVANGTFIKNKHKSKIIAGLIIIGMLLFIKGFVIGWLAERSR